MKRAICLQVGIDNQHWHIDNCGMKIGIDWGGTSIKGASVNEANVLESAHVETPTEPEEALDAIAALVTRLDASPESVGVAIPGEVREDGRCWRLPNIPGFEDVNIAAELRQRLGVDVGVENDAIAAALAERLYGWGNSYKSFLLVTLGTGIGGGVVLDGNVRRGANGFAGEIGHVTVNTAPDAWPCGCGKTGCMEAYAGTKGILRRFSELGGAATNIKQVVEAGGDPANAAFKQAAEALGAGLATINNTLDLDAIVFTGGVANSLSELEPHIRKAMQSRAFAQPLSEIPLQTSLLGEHAGVIGAAHLPTKTESESETLSTDT